MAESADWDPELEKRALATVWRRGPAERVEALGHASDFIDTLPFKGQKQSPLQRRAWPRTEVCRDDGTPIDGVPQEVKETCAMIAGFILTRVPFSSGAMACVLARIGHLIDDGRKSEQTAVNWY